MTTLFEREIGDGTLSFESGKLAQKANGSVLVKYYDNVLLVTATTAQPREGIDFFPLTVDVEERLYARGKIPGSFFKREGRPSTHSILIARLTDRPIRPLFPKDFRNEVQIIATPLSVDVTNPYDVMTIIGASTALTISDIPFEGPISATRIGYIDDDFVVNPSYEQIQKSDLDLVVASSRSGVIMMEAAANEVSEDIALEAIERAQAVNLSVIELQEELAELYGKPTLEYTPRSYDAELTATVLSDTADALDEALGMEDDDAGNAKVAEVKAEVFEKHSENYEQNVIATAFDEAQEAAFKRRVLNVGERPDGRGLKEIRPLSSEVGLFPRTHGTGVFTRGETQVLGVCTLGSVGDAQKIDNLSPEDEKRFMLHYNFPPFSTGEARPIRSTGRREIGHGMLAERALAAVLPSDEEFPYTIRVVGECLSSNGSTSMATVCASTLALMDAGVPIKRPVAGISIGLVTGEGQYVTLTDIQGKEDHMGDMDFKVAGTSRGITAIQLDMKVKYISMDMVSDALYQAMDAREEILAHIAETLPAPRGELNKNAPRMESIKIPQDKIGMVIGPGGKTIRGITDETGASVDIQEDGTVVVGSSDGAAADKAIQMIKDLTKEIEIGEIYTGQVVRTTDFGAFISLLPGKDGMVHISELANYRVPTVEDEVTVGDEVTVLVTDVDQTGRVRLSRRALLDDSDEDDPVAAALARQQRGGRGGGRGGDRGPRRDGGGGFGGGRGGFGGGRDDRRRGPRRDDFGGGRGGFGGGRGGRDDRDDRGRGDRRQRRDRDSGGFDGGFGGGGFGGGRGGFRDRDDRGRGDRRQRRDNRRGRDGGRRDRDRRWN